MDLLTSIRSHATRRPWITTLGVAAFVFVIYAVTRRAHNPYNQYVLLSDAFLHGRVYLVNPPGFLELARFGAKYFVIDPPAPTLFLLPFVWMFGTGADHVLVSCGVGAVAMAMLWIAARRLWPVERVAEAMVVLVAFGTNFWWIASDGGFWSFAHTSAVFFLAGALVEGTGRRRPWLVGLLLGLAGLSRLTVFLMAPLFAYFVIDGDMRLTKASVRKLAWFTAVVGAAAGTYLAYNQLRYGTIRDLGYYHPQYLREPWFAHGRFNIAYIPRHINAIFFLPPSQQDGFPFFKPQTQGLGLFFTTPAFLYAFRARLTPRNSIALAALVLTAVPLVTHGTTGWSQFGYRYALDVLPALLLLTASGMDQRIDRRKMAVLGLCIAVNFWGVLSFNLLHWAG